MVSCFIAGVVIVIGALLVIDNYETKRYQRLQVDKLIEVATPALTDLIEQESPEPLVTFMTRVVNSGNLAGFSLELRTGNDITTYEFASKDNSDKDLAPTYTTKHSFPIAKGSAELELAMYAKNHEKIELYSIYRLIIIILSLLATTLTLKFFLQRNVRQFSKRLSQYLPADESTNSKLSDEPFELLAQTIETLEKNLNEKKNDIAQYEKTLATEREQQLETQRLIEEAKAANKAKSEFIATMSHEIRTPLNGVVGMVEMLRDTPLNNNQKHYLDVLYRSGESLLEIINDILDYSKIESGRMLLERIEFDLAELIDNCFKLFSATASKRNIDLISNITPNTPTLLIGDPTRLRQIIVNLVGNAFKFTSEGYVYVEVRCERDETSQSLKLHFSISDSGIGIEDKDQPYLFEAFRQADSSTTRKFGGSGLGLAICKQLATLMDGEIGVESIVDKGSTFWFTAGFTVNKKALEENPPSCSLALSDKKLLTINLHNIFVKGIEQHAHGWNLNNEHYSSSSDLVSRLSDHKKAQYDFIIIDHQSDKGDGFEIAVQLRSMKAYSTVPILMLTKQQASSFSQTQLYSVTAIVPRPIAIQTLNQTLISQGYGTQLNPLLPLNPIKSNRAKLKVLVAEDNAVNRLVIEGLLSKFEIKPDFAENGQEAVDKFFADPKYYDLILMDCEMPVLNGFDATLRIREEEKNRAISSLPIIALTAHVEASHRQRVFDCGMNHFLSKPVTLAKLNEALASVGLDS